MLLRHRKLILPYILAVASARFQVIHSSLDYFPRDFIMFIDESHVAIPQLHGMSGRTLPRKRKTSLIMASACHPLSITSPLAFSEFEEKVNRVIFVSATPSEYERSHSSIIAEQIIRPTGLVEPRRLKPTLLQRKSMISSAKYVSAQRVANA